MKARNVARGGLLTGVSIVMLMLGSLFEIAGGAITVLASFVPAIFYLRGERQTGRMVYIATSLTALIVVPDKFIALLYMLVLGLYTVLKFRIDRQRSKTVRLIAKGLVGLIWSVLTLVLIRLGFVPEVSLLTPLIALATVAGWELFVVYYDFCLTRIFAGLYRLVVRFK